MQLHRHLLFTLASSLSVASTSAQTPSTGVESRTAFRVLDNVEGAWIGTNVTPVRPLLWTTDGLYAIDAHGNRVVRFPAAATTPSQSFPVPWTPVSIGRRVVAGADELVVVCGGSHVLVRLDRATGETRQLVALPAEPADLLIDPVTDHAFVSCRGVDCVVEIDLGANTIVHTYPVQSKQPVFLSFDAARRVLVAPQLSGNNSSTVTYTDDGTFEDPPGIVDFATHPNVLVGLPDEDLFRIDPVAQRIEPVAKGTGSVLFAQGVNPVSGKLWQLNTEANNKDPQRQTEASVRGDFVKNRLTIVTLPSQPGTIATDHTFIDLDDTDPAQAGVQYVPARSVGQPCALAFAPNGIAAVAGLLTDNVVLLDTAGRVLRELDLPPGSIPRGVVFDPAGQRLSVYAWGRNTVEVFRITNNPYHEVSLAIGPDPTPSSVRAGRALFYSARFSLNNNASCASCHVDGRTDMLVWNLSDPEHDNKGPMITQSLAGLGRTGPLHWRGERPTLLDFNPAFEKLLGGAQLDTAPGGQFDQFAAFVRAIDCAANPLEDERRIIADHGGLAPPPSFAVGHGSALRGQDAFFDGHQDSGTACNRCHVLPAGSGGDMTASGDKDAHPKRTHMKVPHFLEMWRKEQPTVSVTFLHGGTQTYPLLGAGLRHAGTQDSLFEFIDQTFRATPDLEKADLLAFVSQIDQGLAPAVHRALHVTKNTIHGAVARLNHYFIPQARSRNIDLVAYGRVDLGHGPVQLRWVFDRGTGLFVAEDSRVSPRSSSFFLLEALADTANVVFVGVPVGMGATFGVDFDGDDLFNADEVRFGTAVHGADSDGDGFADGYEVKNLSSPTNPASLPSESVPPVVSNLRVQWTSQKVAALGWETGEPSSYQIQLSTPGEPPHTWQSGAFERVRHVLLTGLTPSSGVLAPKNYSGTLRVVDPSGNVTLVPLPAIRTADFFFEEDSAGAPIEPRTVVIGDLKWMHHTAPIPGTLDATALARIDSKFDLVGGRAARNYVAVATLLVNGVRSTTFTSPLPRHFTVLGAAPEFPGPFVLSMPTGANGVARLHFSVSGLNPGDVVSLVIEAVVPIDPAVYDPTQPAFGSPTDLIPLGHWSFPDTAKPLRSIDTTY